MQVKISRIPGLSTKREILLKQKLKELHSKEILPTQVKFRKEVFEAQSVSRPEIQPSITGNPWVDKTVGWLSQGGMFQEPSERFLKAKNPDPATPGLSHSILIVDQEWYILPHRDDSKPKKGGESEVRQVYKVIWPDAGSDRDALPSFSDEFFLVKESQFDPNKSDFQAFYETEQVKTRAIRDHEDKSAIEVWRQTGATQKDNKQNHDKHYVIVKGFPGMNHEEFMGKYGAPLSNDAFNISIKILQEVKKVHDQGKIHGDLSRKNIMIDKERDEVHLIDFSFSVTFADPIRGKTEGYIPPELEYASPDSPQLASPAQDIYALGCKEGSLHWMFSGLVYRVDQGKGKASQENNEEFRQAIYQMCMEHFLAAREPENRPNVDEAIQILSNLQKLQNDEMAKRKFMEFYSQVFKVIENKISEVNQRADSKKKHSKERVDKKVKALKNFQDFIVHGFLRSYLSASNTPERETALKTFVAEITTKNWREDAKTADLYSSTSSKGKCGDYIAGCTFIGFVFMMIRATIAAIRGKSFCDHFTLFAKPSTIDLIEGVNKNIASSCLSI